MLNKGITPKNQFAGSAGLTIIGLGILGWAWLNDWRWALTGLVLGVAATAFIVKITE